MVTILMIEDDLQVQESLKAALKSEDYDIIFTDNGRVGIQKAQEFLPDLIICGVMIPEINGFELLSILKNIEETSLIPFVFLTVKAERCDIRRGMELGADDYITKPFTIQELQNSIATRLKKYKKFEHKYTQVNQQILQKIEQEIYFDKITNLPNRLSLREHFSQIIDRNLSELTASKMLPVLCLSLDRFSKIQGRLGYNRSELLLKAVAERIKNNLDSEAILAHIDGNEFVIILNLVENKTPVVEFAKHLNNQLSKAFLINNQEIFISASIGISLYKRDGQIIETLIRNAKKAMYKVQEKGGNDCEFYSWVLEVKSARQQVLEKDIRQAIQRGEILVYYQPIVSLKTGKVISCEALTRWLHPTHGMVSPTVFIPIAEEIGMIDEIGEWVLNRACQDLQQWLDLGFHGLRMAVNISARQLSKANFRQKAINILLASNLLPKHLEFELNESYLLQNLMTAKHKIDALKSLDIGVAIDDFGSGYSSLKSLQQLPFDTLKIDQFFIQNVDQNSSNSIITSSLIQIAHRLGFRVIAEGVETEGELNFLKQHQCDAIQGFIFSRPLPASELTDLLRDRKCL